MTKQFDTNGALDEVPLSVARGDIDCLLGANGAGKTTLVNLCPDCLQPTSGNVLVDTLDVLRRPLETKRLLAYILEQSRFMACFQAWKILRSSPRSRPASAVAACAP